ncbi:MAG: hypothetical protein U9N01_04505 [Euryarchaeota archaeon]|nr:hypothetical protein [Euryarchaeota archaeon]
MPHNTPAPGKLAADSESYERTGLKRASSNKLDTNVQHAAAGLLYTTTKIIVTKVIAYAATAIAAGSMVLDVGINGDDNQIVDGAAYQSKDNDTVTELTIAEGEVAAGKMVTATVKTASGDAGQAVIVAIEYYESE